MKNIQGWQAVLLVLTLLTAGQVLAKAPTNMREINLPQVGDYRSNNAEAFRYYSEVQPQIIKPTVVEVSLPQSSNMFRHFGIYRQDLGTFEPYYAFSEQATLKPQVETSSATYGAAIADGDYGSYSNFAAYQDWNIAEIFFTYPNYVTSDRLSWVLDSHVATPEKISIYAKQNGEYIKALAPTTIKSSQVYFPRTSAKEWKVALEYVQPLRVNEMEFNNLAAASGDIKIRFLAQPQAKYRIYYDADRYQQMNFFPSGQADLVSDNGVLKVMMGAPMPNPFYKEADVDQDMIPDRLDNCVSVANTDQADKDQNGKGDSCEDFDRDRILNSVDNCPDLPNANQADVDGDGVGDICDDFENRLTERLTWLPWLGLGVAGLVILGLFYVVLTMKPVVKNDAEQ